MLVSLNWIKEYVAIPNKVTADQLAHDVTMSTVEVESVIDQQVGFAHMVVGRIVELKKHPDADKLQLAMTDVGTGVKQIVCGGINLSEGMLVAVAKPGAQVRWHGEGDLVTLENATIRGQESFGMICAASEIGLGDAYRAQNEREILDISFTNAKPGTALAKALELTDTILEIDNKSLTNRPDLWGHYGMAREIAAIFKSKLAPLELTEFKAQGKTPLSIKIESKLCSRYIGVVIENVAVAQSPIWMQSRLIAAGMRPINTIVDLTNYVMLETGQPLHAFDYKQLHEETIVVRQAKQNEVLKTLDGEERTLSRDMLVVADKDRAHAVAGIKGGIDSGVADDTTTIVLEAANFDSVSVRKTVAALDLRTDASQRHEKGLDVERANIGAARFVALLKQLQPKSVVTTVVDSGIDTTPSVKIKTDRDFIIGRLGHDLSTKDIAATLTSLGFEVKTKKDSFEIAVPSWRATGDVSIPEDIVEEVGRMFGYDNLEFTPPVVALTGSVYQPAHDRLQQLREYLAFGAGMNEVYHYPWSYTKSFEQLGIDTGNLVELGQPPSEEQRYLQNSLLPNMLESVEKNLRFYDAFGLFEIAQTFEKVNKNKPAGKQTKKVLGVVVGTKPRDVFEQTKGIVEGLSRFADITSKSSNDHAWFDANGQLQVELGGKPIGYVGFLSKTVRQSFGIEKRFVGVFELEVMPLIDTESAQNKYTPLPKYPVIERDIALEVGYDVTWDDVQKAVAGSHELVQAVQFVSDFDLGEKKSLAFRIVFGADKTLESTEVEEVEKQIVAKLQKKFNAVRR